jgi:hypothetical protein
MRFSWKTENVLWQAHGSRITPWEPVTWVWTWETGVSANRQLWIHRGAIIAGFSWSSVSSHSSQQSHKGVLGSSQRGRGWGPEGLTDFPRVIWWVNSGTNDTLASWCTANLHTEPYLIASQSPGVWCSTCWSRSPWATGASIPLSLDTESTGTFFSFPWSPRVHAQAYSVVILMSQHEAWHKVSPPCLMCSAALSKLLPYRCEQGRFFSLRPVSDRCGFFLDLYGVSLWLHTKFYLESTEPFSGT